MVAGLSTQRNAISMLHSRIAAILEYLSGVHQGKIAPDHETLRQISSLVSSITSSSTSESTSASKSPTASTSGTAGASLASEFEQEQNDVTLISLLNLMTKSLDEANMLVDKFGITYARDHGRGEDDMFGMGGQMRRGGGGVGGPRKASHADGARRPARRNVDSFF